MSAFKHQMISLAMVLNVMISSCYAFIPSSSSMVVLQPRSSATSATLVSMAQDSGVGGLFGQDGAFGKMFGNNNVPSVGGPTTIITIPTKNVKIGALRFLLQIHLVSEQNKPTPKTWNIRQGDTNENGELQIYYTDGTAMLSILLQESGITIQRHGQRPSLQYQLQESVILHSVLDELSNIAFGIDESDKNIEDEKRLLVLYDTNAIEAARATLPIQKSIK